jgi:hypothetical protein
MGRKCRVNHTGFLSQSVSQAPEVLQDRPWKVQTFLYDLLRVFGICSFTKLQLDVCLHRQLVNTKASAETLGRKLPQHRALMLGSTIGRSKAGSSHLAMTFRPSIVYARHDKLLQLLGLVKAGSSYTYKKNCSLRIFSCVIISGLVPLLDSFRQLSPYLYSYLQTPSFVQRPD